MEIDPGYDSRPGINRTLEKLLADNERLLRGIARICEYLEANRVGDAQFDCEALLAGSAFEPRPKQPQDGKP